MLAAKQSRLEPIPAPPRLRSLVTKLSMAMVTCERQSVRVRLSARLTLLNKAWSAVALLPSTAAVVSYTCNASSGVQLLDVHRGKHALISRGFVGECTVQVDAYVAYANKSCTGTCEKKTDKTTLLLHESSLCFAHLFCLIFPSSFFSSFFL